MQPVLSFEQAPPISVPFRFLLTAPLFGIAAGVYLAWAGAAALESRWAPGALTLTHLMTAGFMLQAMCGALFQLIAVAVGGNVWRPGLVAGIVHPLLVAGAVLLAAAFALLRPPLFLFAAAMFVPGLSIFLVVAGIAAVRTSARGPALSAMRVALLALAFTLAFGAAIAIGLGMQASLRLIELVNVHALWGLGGWSMALLAGASYLLVPMFQMTAPYPPRLAHAFPLVLLAACALASLQLAEGADWSGYVGSGAIAFASAIFAAVTLRLQYRRRRKLTDPTLLFFRGSMIAILAVLASLLVFAASPELGGHPRAPVWIGILLLVGGFGSAICGAAYKIVPFLNWLHLQRLNPPRGSVPLMNQMITERGMRGHMAAHFVSLGLLLASVLFPELSRIAGISLVISFAWFEWNLVNGARVYRGFSGTAAG